MASGGPVSEAKQAGDDAERVTFLDQALWAALSSDRPGTSFAAAWLTLFCRQVRDVERGVLALQSEAGATLSTARWPEGDGGSPELAHAVELCLQHKKGVANVPSTGRGQALTSSLAYPVLVDDKIQAVVGIETSAAGEAAARVLMRDLRWGVGWLELALRRIRGQDVEARLTRATIALEVVSLVQTARGFDHQARAFATELTNRTAATRVAIGWVRGRTCKVVALSHGVAFSRRMDLIVRMNAAMNEALDQEQTIAYVPEGHVGTSITREHAALAQKSEAVAVVSVPLVAHDRILGVVTAEYDRVEAVTQREIDILEAVAALGAPALENSRTAERPLHVHLVATLSDVAARIFGRGHLALKLGILVFALATLFFTFFETEYRPSGRATVEGEVRRTIAAAIDGYVASEHARAGQSIKKDAPLATLDATEFKLQRLRWVAVKEQHQLELNKNLAAGQRADVNILRSQIDEADAQIALLDDEIARTSITAPFDGIVLSGDLSQSIGAPVQRAQTLFEIAPLDAYRVVMRVPDTDVARVHPGQRGTLILSALPDDRFAFQITRITPVAEVSDGQNAFRVEGKLDRISDRLRPNMEGAARIEAGQERLIWIWTHHLLAAVRIALWSWWP